MRVYVLFVLCSDSLVCVPVLAGYWLWVLCVGVWVLCVGVGMGSKETKLNKIVCIFSFQRNSINTKRERDILASVCVG
jgi:hypothetical protein